MSRTIIGIIFAVLAFGGSTGAWADEATTTTSTTTTNDVGGGGLTKSIMEIKPEVGSMSYTNPFGATDSRGVAGLDVEFNMTGFIPSGSPLFTGLQTGVVYSHIGQASSGFFGSEDTNNATSAGANMLMLPVDAKLGWNLTDAVRISAHGGGNLLYRTVGSSMALGDSSNTDGGIWRIFPNVGGDLDFQLLRGTALMLRPDWTLAPDHNIFTATIGLGISLG